MHIAKIRMMSKVLFLPTNLVVALPDGVTAGRRKYKVLWLLHGANGDCETWLQNKYFEDALKSRDMIAVLPSALNSDYGNYPEFGTGYNFADFFFDELMPFIYGNFPASDKPEDNFIAGSSMGGYGSLALGLLHPEKFGGIGVFGASLRESAFLAPYEGKPTSEFRKDALASPESFPTEYGSPNGIKLKEINIISKYATVDDFLNSFECMWRRLPEVAAAGKVPSLYVACGDKDLFYEPTLRFRDLAAQLGITDAKFVLAPGEGHYGEFFDQQLAPCLDWFEKKEEVL